MLQVLRRLSLMRPFWWPFLHPICPYLVFRLLDSLYRMFVPRTVQGFGFCFPSSFYLNEIKDWTVRALHIYTRISTKWCYILRNIHCSTPIPFLFAYIADLPFYFVCASVEPHLLICNLHTGLTFMSFPVKSLCENMSLTIKVLLVGGKGRENNARTFPKWSR